MSPASSCHGLSDLWIIRGNSWRIHDGTAGMMKNPEVLGQCRGSRGRGEKTKGKEERRGTEGSRERRARAGGILRRREAQNLLHVATNSCSNL
jgi:hypothetical protein